MPDIVRLVIIFIVGFLGGYAWAWKEQTDELRFEIRREVYEEIGQILDGKGETCQTVKADLER